MVEQSWWNSDSGTVMVEQSWLNSRGSTEDALDRKTALPVSIEAHTADCTLFKAPQS